jgi:beta-glucosidase
MVRATFLAAVVACPLSSADMLWGTATAAYQVEGYRKADGRQPSVWDAFDTVGISEVIKAVKPNGQPNVDNSDNAGRAIEDYVRFPESVALASEHGFETMRLSVSWSRVMSYDKDEATGELVWRRNEKGIQHYHEMFQAYRHQGIKVALTMFHWDLPLIIEEEAAKRDCQSAWLCHDFIPALFEDYAKLLLEEYAPEVDWWITINEPLTIISVGYTGTHAPGRCSDRERCFAGDVTTEPYSAAKGLILSHSRAFRAWEAAGKPGHGCGITLNGDWRVPATDSDADKAAQTRSIEWQASIFADPIHFGRWPQSMVEAVGQRLPSWTPQEVKLIQGAHDEHFFMNHYTTLYVRAGDDAGCGWNCDAAAETSGYNFANGEAIGTPSSNGWLYNYGPGLGLLMNWYNERYPGSKFLVTENGWGNASATVEDEVRSDLERCNFYRDYIGNMSAIATQNDIDVVAYYAWSMVDNYEWADGFATRFGLTFVNYTSQERTPKMSLRWFKKHVTGLRALPSDGKPLPPCDPEEFVERTVIV